MNIFMRILYFYGFASGPESTKAKFFQNKMTELNLDFEIIDYISNEESFSSLKVSKLVDFLQKRFEASEEEDFVLWGSSFGAFIALWLTFKFPKQIKGLILMAPAIYFSTNTICTLLGISIEEWKRSGEVIIQHNRFKKPLGLQYAFYQDLIQYPPPDFNKVVFSLPIVIFHGINDKIIPITWSREFSRKQDSVSLFELEADHQLLKQMLPIWNEVKAFLNQYR